MEIEGYVNEFLFKNPHVNLILTVTDESGAETPWMVTAPATAAMRRWGWTEEALKEGQYLRVHGNPSRDGGPMMLLEGRALREGEVVILELDPTDGSIISPVVGTNQVERRTADSLSPTLSDDSPLSTPLIPHDHVIVVLLDLRGVDRHDRANDPRSLALSECGIGSRIIRGLHHSPRFVKGRSRPA